MHGLETDGVDVFENVECSLQGSLPLVCGLCEETLRVTTSTDKLEVKVLPHMAESHVRVLINNSTVGTESELSVPSSEAKRLPREALVTVEVRQKEILVCTHMELGGHNGCQAWRALAGKGG